MKLSTKSRYGIRMLVDLARHHEQGPVTIRDISRRQDISVKYLEQVIRPLQKAKLVKSTRGPKGGHVLAKRPREITMGEIVRLFEGQIDLVKCISFPQDCHMSEDCRVRLAWQEATRALFKKLDAITIADLVADISMPEQQR